MGKDASTNNSHNDLEIQPRSEICEEPYLLRELYCLPPTLILGNCLPGPLWTSFPVFDLGY